MPSVIKTVVVIYMAAGTHPIQNDYSHGSRFSCQNVYIYGCRASSIKMLFTRQTFLIPNGLYTRLPCIKYKSAIFTAAVSHAKMYIYNIRYIHGCRLSSIKALFTRRRFLCKTLNSISLTVYGKISNFRLFYEKKNFFL